MRDRFTGCLLGHALGDAVGAKREGGLAARLLWWILGLRQPSILRWTDDTQMSLVLSRHLSAHGGIDPDLMAVEWAEEARWSRGYGRGALRTLHFIRKGTRWQEASRRVFADGSYGNGAAMRAAPIGLAFKDRTARLDAALQSAAITHAHPLGMAGAVLMAEATHLALHHRVTTESLRAVCDQQEFITRLDQANELLRGEPAPDAVAQQLGNSVLAHESVVTAIYVYRRFRAASFQELLEFVLAIGGDTDTIGAMSGALYGADRGEGALPRTLLSQLEAGEELRATALKLAGSAVGGL